MGTPSNAFALCAAGAGFVNSLFVVVVTETSIVAACHAASERWSESCDPIKQANRIFVSTISHTDIRKLVTLYRAITDSAMYVNDKIVCCALATLEL
jgi:hypothetical protein